MDERIMTAPTERSMPAVRMIRGLGDCEGSHHRDLLGDQGQVLNTQEPLIEEPEDHHRNKQDNGRAERRIAVEDVADSAERGLTVEEFLGRVCVPCGGRSGGLLLGHCCS
jgi:hypothetical protein